MSSGSNLEGGDVNDEVRIFVGDTDGPESFVSFFEEERGKGNLYVSDQKGDRIVKHLQIYDDSRALLRPEEADVQVFWSTDGTRCGVAIWGKMWGIVDIVNGHEIHASLENRSSSPIADFLWLKGFERYLDQEQFIRARQRYWKERIKEQESVEPLPEERTPIQTNFVVYERGHNRTFAVFEDDGESGYLYLYGPVEQTILRFLHVYDRNQELNVAREDVQVLWSESGLKCGVVIWARMRGIIDLTKDDPGRVWLKNRSTPGIDDPEWLSGF